MKDNIFRISVCPKCGQTYTAPSATARDGSGPICPDCGTREALESIGVLPSVFKVWFSLSVYPYSL